MAWGVEARVPFLDKDFMEVVMSLDPDNKLIRKGQVPPTPCHTRCCRSAAYSMLQGSRCVFSVKVGDERVLSCRDPLPPPSRTNWTRLVPHSVLSGHISSLPSY